MDKPIDPSDVERLVGDDYTNTALHIFVRAVTRAVCPDGYMVVPVALIETWLPVLDNVYGMGHMADQLRSLLPTEEKP